MLVVSHESVGAVAFYLWAALHLSCILSTTFAEIVIVGVARSVATQQPCTKQKLAP